MRFYRTGEVATDIGIIAFKNFLEDMKLKKDVDFLVKLEKNYLEVEEIKDFEILYTDYIWDKLKEKNEDKSKDVYLPYLRNSGKFGANSGSESKARENLKKIIKFTLGLINSKEELEEYQIQDNNCNICRTYKFTGLDINQKPRITSKYIYSFLGSESNTYSNHGNEKIGVCFVCEFLYLNFLIYASMGNYNLIYTENLKELEFLNYKINLFKDFSDLGFQQKMAEYNKNNLKIYKMYPDPNKGILVKLVNYTNFNKLKENLKMSYIIEKFNIKTGEKTNLKKQIDSENIENVKEVLLGSILIPEGNNQKIENNKLFLEFLKIGGKILEEKNYDEFFKRGKEVSKAIGVDGEGKKSVQERIAFKLIKLMQSDNRARILSEIMNLFIVNKVEIPFKFSEAIVKGDRDNLHFAVGKFIEGLMNNKEQNN